MLPAALVRGRLGPLGSWRHPSTGLSSVSRAVMTLDDEPIVFTFMATGFHVPASQIDGSMNQALLRLVRYPRDLHEE